MGMVKYILRNVVLSLIVTKYIKKKKYVLVNAY